MSPSKNYFKKIHDSFELLKQYSKNNFDKVNKYLNVIIIHPKHKTYNQLIYKYKEKNWIVGYNIFADESFDPLYIASLLIHETYHITQYLSGHKNYGEKAETAAYLQQRKFLKKVNYKTAVEWLDKHYKNKWWKSMDKMSQIKKEFNKLFSDYKQNKIKIKLI